VLPTNVVASQAEATGYVAAADVRLDAAKEVQAALVKARANADIALKNRYFVLFIVLFLTGFETQSFSIWSLCSRDCCQRGSRRGCEPGRLCQRGHPGRKRRLCQRGERGAPQNHRGRGAAGSGRRVRRLGRPPAAPRSRRARGGRLRQQRRRLGQRTGGHLGLVVLGVL
jgi:hypothetical protein